jgi:hypothetical protein
MFKVRYKTKICFLNQQVEERPEELEETASLLNEENGNISVSGLRLEMKESNQKKTDFELG